MRLPLSAAGNVLVLDLGTSFGFAHGPLERLGGRRPHHGSAQLRQPVHVERVAALRHWIDERQVVFGRWTAICVEAAIIGNFSSRDAERLTVALHSMVELWARDEEIPFLACDASTARKAMIGRGTFKKGQAKGEVDAWCRNAGFTPKTDDDADAILLWHAVADATLGRQ